MTVVLTGLLALATLGSVFTAWLGFVLLPVWSVVVGLGLLVRREPPAVVDESAVREPVAAG